MFILLFQMVSDYVAASNDTSVLERALPLAGRELAWWHTNRTVNVTSPYTNQTYEVYRYAVNNSAPRPESYLTGICFPLSNSALGEAEELTAA